VTDIAAAADLPAIGATSPVGQGRFDLCLTRPSFPAMGSFGPLEIILIFLVVLLIFGAKRIPEIARGIGKGIREFKDATNEISRELESEAQNRQINKPRSPQQGQPQSRQPQAQASSNPQQSGAQQAEQQDAAAEPPPRSEGDSAPETAENADKKTEQSS
jgi:sec-independent protein translocase protein TatA